jgi:hypothetical protein
VQVKGNRIIDDKGRSLLLRGCNIGGSSKLPAAPAEAAGQGPLSLENPQAVSFAGRPFPLEEAEEHFERLRSWGMAFIRLVITWEALEHSGPGIYDESYLAYLRKLLLIAESRGISVFIDPHQDVWSRWTGGSGAPAWTMEKLGIKLEKLDSTGAAVTFQHYRELSECKPYWRKDGETSFFWPVNYSRYGAATMFTLFFAGNAYAPDFKIEGEPAQDWLQERYIAAFRHCFRRLKNCGAITGWGVMNEPHPGFIGCQNLAKLENQALAFGPMPSPFEAMAAAGGHTIKTAAYVPWLKNPLKTGSVFINPKREKLFKEGFICPWKQAGIWTDEGGLPRLLKKDHFARFGGRPAVFTGDFLKPFIRRFIERMKEAERPCLFFIEGVAEAAHISWQKTDGEGVVNAFHHYDGPALFLKKFNPHFTADPRTGRIILGRKKVASFWAKELGKALDWSRDQMENIPCLLGEFGLPFNLDRKRAYKNGDYSRHEEALSLYYDGVDKNLLHSTIWNYTPDNTHAEGDRWNGEDLSIYHNGEGRAMSGWLRPYPMASAGEPLSINWNRKDRRFCFRLMADSKITAPTEIFFPAKLFETKPQVKINCTEPDKFSVEYQNESPCRILVYNKGFDGEVEISVQLKNL